jgi:hypothetical protein
MSLLEDKHIKKSIEKHILDKYGDEVTAEVISRNGSEVKCKVTVPGKILSSSDIMTYDTDTDAIMNSDGKII